MICVIKIKMEGMNKIPAGLDNILNTLSLKRRDFGDLKKVKKGIAISE